MKNLSDTGCSLDLAWAVAAGLAAAILSCVAGHAATIGDPADLAAISGIEDALQEPGDAKVLAGNYAQDATMLDAVAPGIHRGRMQIVQALQSAGSNAVARHVQHRVLESSLVSDGTMACDALEVRHDIEASDGTVRHTELRRLDVFAKIGGRWLIVQEQLSAPADRKTGAISLAGPLLVRGAAAPPAGLFAAPALDQAVAKAGIRQWTDAALRVIGIEPAMDFFDPGGSVVLYGEFAPGNMRSTSEIRAYYAGIMGSYTAIDVVNPILEVSSDGKLGAQIDTQELVLHLNNGTTRPIFIRQSDCLRHTGGKWHTFMEMVSFPVDQASGRAVMGP